MKRIAADLNCADLTLTRADLAAGLVFGLLLLTVWLGLS
jgi:hypothetical protein